MRTLLRSIKNEIIPPIMKKKTVVRANVVVPCGNIESKNKRIPIAIRTNWMPIPISPMKEPRNKLPDRIPLIALFNPIN